ncbi:MAG TPA: hypothetical protein PK331_13555 [Gordonia sp. (in: high G+C Gram-positive bacteria)]|uniref:LmrA/YxaF family transcription factor n=1 Tax=unclassified Gordonia (in: high G+C Gram-positive bacteria) TaxID=2657482 RepID=UPI0025C09CF6|nr:MULTISPECIES: hypothetical protein [unclassified Gordonia (in: high G+C Gram-positive bacteria)]HNP56699.1 hypothetical protein [Gordonia sp. (in: high G+C Gram-positive bacteria)]HRC51933.1 hypothetical protein [Gordonia sp. (in: high G+C Gram-positive bacteria)]
MFTTWISELAVWFSQTGLGETACRRLALAFLTSMEGAFVLCRSLRSTEPMTAAGAAVAALVQAELGAAAKTVS